MSGEFQFQALWVFVLLPLPWLVYRMLPRAHHNSAALKVPFYTSLESLEKGTPRLRSSRLWLILLCWLLLVISAARPQWIGEHTSVPLTGRDLMMAVDISGSMKARDMYFNHQPENRLEAVKRVAGDFIQRRKGDRIGLILFGTNAYLQAPLSLDRITVDQLLQESAIGLAGEKTAIGDAIGLAVKRLNDRPGTEKLLVLLTDGANTAGETNPLDAAELAKLAGLRIYTIGFGSDASGQKSFFGQNLFSRRNAVDIATLREVATITSGKFFRATDTETLEEIYRLIDRLEPVEQELDDLKPLYELFYIPLGFALFLSFGHTLFNLIDQSIVEQKRERKMRVVTSGLRS
ncbi:MAG: VWA domain-containing protein [Acidiferrobacterales bacterium]|nr:VWA domain-containing protein [Acidiferrobacterales bacterium]